MPIELWKELLAPCVEMTFGTDHAFIRGPTMEQIDQRRLFNFEWCRWSYWNDNGGNATSGKRVGNATGKDDNKHSGKRDISSCNSVSYPFSLRTVSSSNF